MAIQEKETPDLEFRTLLEPSDSLRLAMNFADMDLLVIQDKWACRSRTTFDVNTGYQESGMV
jgi:hypothetical protein